MRRYNAAPKGATKGSTGPPAYFLPEELYNSFKPKPTIHFWKTPKKQTNFKQELGGLAKFSEAKFEQPEMIPKQRLPKEEDKADKIVKQRWELKEVAKERKQCEYAIKTQRRLTGWDPHNIDDKKTPNGYNTLFVGRLNSKITEQELTDFMKTSSGGEIVKVRIIRNLKHPKRSYAFVEFADGKALQKAYQSTDGVQFGGTYIVTDVERGRTVRAWVPRKFGGGLGGPPRIKGYVVKKGRGPPEPPAVESRKRRGDYRGYQNERPPHPRMSHDR
jgi:U1 small nuclear ribonucleoprotein